MTSANQDTQLLDQIARAKREWLATCDAISDPLMLVDCTGKVVRGNQALAEWLELRVQDLPGRDHREVFAGPHTEEDCVVFSAIRTRHSAEIDLHDPATNRRFHVRGFPVFGPRGEVTSVVVLVQDVTERVRTEEALRETTQMLQTLIDRSPLAIVATDTDWNVKMWNSAAERIFGWSPEEVLGRPLPIIPDDQREEARELRERALGGEPVVEAEAVRRRKDGSQIAVSLSTAALHDSQGRASGLMAVFIDITERKRAEEERLRIGRLSALGELASGVAHDFNNVLFGVMGFAELLRSKLTDPQLRHYCDRIHQGVADGGEIVRRMQAFYKAHLESSEKTTLNINQIIRQALDLTRPRWKDRPEAEGVSAEVVTEFAQMPLAEGHPSELREVFTNLILNALDAMPSGGRLTLSTGCGDEASRPRGSGVNRLLTAAGRPRLLRVQVSDTGVGMDAETLRHCLEPFFTTKGERGSGLGLSLVYRIVSEHGGTIDIDSEPGRGTTVSILLPVAPDAILADELQEIPATGPSLHILVIDDEEAARAVLGDGLRQLGHTVEVAEGGAAGLEIFRQGRFDAVITDLGMPEMNGLAVAEAIRGHSPTTPVILLTGWGNDFDEGQVRRYGIASVLRKPLPLTELAAALTKVTLRIRGQGE